MAIIKCPECGQDVSDIAAVCVHCGYPLKAEEKKIEESRPEEVKTELTCPECGQVIKAEDVTCPQCGFPLKKNTKPKGITLAIVGGAVAIAVCAVVALLYLGSGDPVDKYIKYLVANDYDKALTLYNKKIVGKSELETELESEIKRLSDAIYDGYLNESISEEQAKKTIKSYGESQLCADYVMTISNKIDGLATSRANYKKAVEAEESSNLQEAYDLYSKVISNDPNYESAQAKVKKLAEKIKDIYVTQAEDLIKEKKFDEAIEKIDDAIAIVGNTTELSKIKALYDEKKYERDSVDVRNVKFGDSIETVKKYEKCEILDESVDGLVVADTLDGNDVWVCYFFNEDDQLYMVVYSIEERFSNYDLYISAYDNIVEKLVAKYGNASKTNNQRSSMANYCSSEGMALQLGYLAKESLWNLDDMIIKSRLYCPNDLTFIIGYQSTKIQASQGSDDL
ncbi:zinc ribbon domain-containing protein [Butyrivibrio sp. XBB1001]|uniref:zinc ribbon domain-containing protein n=1 Tax=Butyrivibrio sp. XBB1001 TaxID=1280682 RepID=UPI0004204197|nr:zinc ribbon domain-containing protein [Butyrivibrio sp. XBB1001]